MPLQDGSLNGVFSVRVAEQRARWLGVAIALPPDLRRRDGEHFFLTALRGAGQEMIATVRWQDGCYSSLPAIAI